jgi:hypothetical protein
MGPKSRVKFSEIRILHIARIVLRVSVFQIGLVLFEQYYEITVIPDKVFRHAGVRLCHVAHVNSIAHDDVQYVEVVGTIESYVQKFARIKVYHE